MFNRLYKCIQWFLAIGIILAFCVIGAYFYKFHAEFGNLSKDWADFGSLLAGVFTLCGALATISTLLFIHKENEDNKNIVQQQVEALTFEQYLKHRDLFIKILTDTAKDCPREIELYNLDELYKKIFPDNKPTNRPCYAVETTCTKSDLSAIVERYKTLKSKLESNDTSCAFDLVRMMEILNINSTEEPSNGDLIFAEVNTGINIYNLESKVYEIFKLMNALLYFTGNEDVKSVTHLANSGALKLSLIKKFIDTYPARDTFYATKKGPWLKPLEELFLRFSQDPVFRSLFKETDIKIQLGFSGRDEIAKLLNDTDSFLQCFMQEHSEADNNRKNLSEEEETCIDVACSSIDKLNSIRQLGGSIRK